MTRATDALVFNAKFASVVGGQVADLGARRLRRFYLQAVARELLPEHRIAECLRSVVPGKGCVNIHYSKKHERAHYGNLVQCANVWTDPVCSSKITERKRVELEEALSLSPWHGVMVTYTMQHDRSDKLRLLWDDLNGTLRLVKSGWWWQTFTDRWGIVGNIISREVTDGLEFGWNAHVHELHLVESKLDTEAIRSELSPRFEAIMAKMGRYVSPENGVHVRATDHTVADYISKWGAAYEMTKASAKRGRGDRYSPFELLQIYAEGGGMGGKQTWAGERYKEYAAAMKGVNQIRWSPGLRKLLSLGVEASDQELVEAPMESDVLLASLNLKQWSIILKRDKKGELLEVASSGSRSDLVVYLRVMGISLADD